MNRLPRIAADVPARLTPSTSLRANAALAAYLTRAGVLRRTCLPDQWDDALRVCAMALENWVRRSLGPLHHLHPSFGIELMPWGGNGEQCPVLTWWQNGTDTLQVGPALERLERSAPGLGATALDALVRQNTYPMFTPVDALEEAEHLFWQGEADESWVLANCCDSDEERAEMAAGMIKRADFDKDFPAWVLDRNATRLNRAALERLHAAGGACSAVAGQLLRIERLAPRLSAGRTSVFSAPADPRPADGNADDEYWDDPGVFFGYAARLEWRNDDLTARVFDEVDHYAMQGDAHDWMGRVRFALEQPCQLRGWMRAMQPHLAMIGLLDGLLTMLVA